MKSIGYLIAAAMFVLAASSLQAQTTSSRDLDGTSENQRLNSTDSLTATPQQMDRWRYRRHNNEWWYWTPDNSWLYWREGRWNWYDRNSFVPPRMSYRSYDDGRLQYRVPYDSRIYDPAGRMIYQDNYYGIQPALRNPASPFNPDIDQNLRVNRDLRSTFAPDVDPNLDREARSTFQQDINRGLQQGQDSRSQRGSQFQSAPR
jgi:hypothetical protein